MKRTLRVGVALSFLTVAVVAAAARAQDTGQTSPPPLPAVESVVLTNVTPDEAVTQLQQDIAEAEMQAAEAFVVDQSEVEVLDEAAAYSAKAAYLREVLTVLCTQYADLPGC